MARNKRAFTLRPVDGVFDQIGILAKSKHYSMTNYIEYALLKPILEMGKEHGELKLLETLEKQTAFFTFYNSSQIRKSSVPRPCGQDGAFILGLM